METKKVYAAICAITEELSKIGIAKNKRNQQQGYAFRGIDDVYFALSPLLARYKLCILPRVIEQKSIEKTTQKGGTLFYTTVTVEYDFVSAEDGSQHTIKMIGEAMDSGDKSSNKAQSAAYKYAAFQAFCIPTEESSHDADADSHELKPVQPEQIQYSVPNPTIHVKIPDPAQVFTNNSMEDTLITIQETDSIDIIQQMLNKARSANANDEQMSILVSAATNRKNKLLDKGNYYDHSK